MEYTPQMLRAKGVAIPVAQVRRVEEKIGPPPSNPLDDDERETRVRWEPVVDEDGDIVEEDKPWWLKFSMNVVADLEERFGSQVAFQRDFEVRPTSAVRDVISVACGVSVEEAGARMIGRYQDLYRSAVGAAWGQAFGADPTKLATAMREAVRGVKEKIAAVDGMLIGIEETEEGSSPGDPTSEPGPEPAEASTSSGD